MATLVLTTIGTAIGGPIGGAVGAILGQAADQRLFAPKGRQGARLGALTVQTSAYGQPIPKLFGRMRVAGTVIWATDLREQRQSSGGGKGKPKATSYSYSASFAVALSGRAIRGVERIWADGKLLRGEAGDWKSETGAFRLHLGDEEQAVDPLIAAAEGTDGAPGYRGTAYAVFEDLQLADFGNRIPSLSFEVEADDAAVTIAAIAAALSDGATGGETAAALGGYAASGDSVRGAIEGLARAIPLSFIDDGGLLLLSDAPPEPVAVDGDELGAAAGTKRAQRRDFEREAAGTLPDEIALTYYEPGRDYQAGLQRARRGGPGRRVEAIDLPATLDAGEAKAAAERRLAERWAARTRASITLPWRRIGLRPGGAVGLPGGDITWAIAGWAFEGMVLGLRLKASETRSALPVHAVPGRATVEPGGIHGPTVLALLDLPPLTDESAAMPRIWVAASGDEPGWRRAALLVSTDAGASWSDAGATAGPAIMGSATGVLAPGDAALFDTQASVEIELLNASMLLESRDDDALITGANLAMLGDELIQFGTAEQVAPKRFRLSRLLRGRRGSEWAAASHAAGERFVLIEAATLLAVDVPPAAIGTELRVIASGVGDPVGVEAGIVAQARAVRPPAPVHLTAERLDDAAIRFGWTRRSRRGWNWNDGGDAPIGEESERYRLTITPAVGTARTVEIGAPGFDYSAADQAEDGASAETSFTISVAQMGSVAASMPAATRSFSI